MLVQYTLALFFLTCFDVEGIKYQSFKWTPIGVSATFPQTKFDKNISYFDALKKCLLIPDCKLVCYDDLTLDFAYSNREFKAHHCENESNNLKKCWTNLEFTDFGLLKEDNIHYAYMVDNQLNFNSAKKCCRKLHGYKLAVLKTDESFEIAREITANATIPYARVNMLANPDKTIKATEEGITLSKSIDLNTPEHNTLIMKKVGGFKAISVGTLRPVLCQKP